MITEELAEIYHSNIFSKEGKKALSYIYGRGIDYKTIRKFKIGYSYNGIAYKELSKKYSDEELLSSGLFNRSEEKNIIYEYFYNRIIFPIIFNNVVRYMTSRTLSNNNGVTHLHQHGTIDYAINHDVLSHFSYVVIVEGPFDCMTLSKNNIPSIGLLGANRLSRKIAEDLKGKRVYIAFDKEENKVGDKAGVRIAQKLSDYGISCRKIDLPYDGKKEDVNSFFQKYKTKHFIELMNRAKLIKVDKKFPRKYKSFKIETDIIPIAEKYLELIYSGGKYKANCPFHSETYPSLVFYPETNTYYCFGCHAFGNVVSLVKKLEEQKGNKITYKEAIKLINT